MQYVFLELPKYAAGPHPSGLVDKWALFFREAENLDVIPPELDEEPFREAFEIARMAQLTEAEHEAYERAKMAEQDARGALGLAREQGEARGEEQTLRRNVRELCEALGIGWNDELRSTVVALSLEELRELWRSLLRDRRCFRGWHPGQAAANHIVGLSSRLTVARRRDRPTSERRLGIELQRGTMGAMRPMTIDLDRGEARPYFLWDEDMSIGEFRERLAGPESWERTRLLTKLLREARDIDVWRFLTPQEVAAVLPSVARRLGRRRRFWEFLIEGWRQDGLL